MRIYVYIYIYIYIHTYIRNSVVCRLSFLRIVHQVDILKQRADEWTSERKDNERTNVTNDQTTERTKHHYDKPFPHMGSVLDPRSPHSLFTYIYIYVY